MSLWRLEANFSSLMLASYLHCFCTAWTCGLEIRDAAEAKHLVSLSHPDSSCACLQSILSPPSAPPSSKLCVLNPGCPSESLGELKKKNNVHSSPKNSEISILVWFKGSSDNFDQHMGMRTGRQTPRLTSLFYCLAFLMGIVYPSCICGGASFPGGTSGKESTCQCRRLRRCGFDSWVRKDPLWRKWQPIPVFLPGEFHDRGAWWATVHRVAKSQTRLNWLSMHTYIRAIDQGKCCKNGYGEKMELS